MLRSVGRETLGLLVRLTRTSLGLVKIKAELAAARMALSVSESGMGPESSTSSSMLTPVYPGVKSGAPFAVAAFLVMAVVHCWTGQDGGAPEEEAFVNKDLRGFGVRGWHCGGGGGGGGRGGALKGPGGPSAVVVAGGGGGGKWQREGRPAEPWWRPAWSSRP